MEALEFCASNYQSWIAVIMVETLLYIKYIKMCPTEMTWNSLMSLWIVCGSFVSQPTTLDWQTNIISITVPRKLQTHIHHFITVEHSTLSHLSHCYLFHLTLNTWFIIQNSHKNKEKPSTATLPWCLISFGTKAKKNNKEAHFVKQKT